MSKPAAAGRSASAAWVTVVARRQPRNPLGWLFLLAAIVLFVSNDGGDYSYFVYRLGHHIPFGPRRRRSARCGGGCNE